MNDASSLPPPVQQRKTTQVKPKPRGPRGFLAQLDPKNALHNHTKSSTTQSMPSSPALEALRPQPSKTSPTSAPALQDAKARKMQALREALVHLLAVCPVSEKFIAQKLACGLEDCREVLNKVGKHARLDPTKWDLSDRAFKELDVWKFKYGSNEDRNKAIDRAVSAFDRMRLSTQDKSWQMLLPKADRGKNICLSKLNLHSGPIQTNTPKIHVQRTDDWVNGNTTGNESERKGRLAPSDAEPMVRSKSSDQIRKKRVSDREAQAKRLLSKNPKKAAPTPKTKETVKKGLKAPLNKNVKSTEFVHDSDEEEEDEMNDGLIVDKPTDTGDVTHDVGKTPQNGSRTDFPTSEPEPKAAKAEGNNSGQLANLTPTNPPSSNPTNPGSQTRLSSSSQSSSGTSKTFARQRNTSSPLKPSPLGSSPPTNASDLDNDIRMNHTSTSSTSSTPLLAQSSKQSDASKMGIGPAVRLPQSDQNNFERSLKRKAEGLVENDPSGSAPLTNGQVSPKKRAKTSVLSPPATDGSDSSPNSDGHRFTIEQAQRFKRYYAKYERMYREIASMQKPPADEVKRVKNMHRRLAELKDQISKAVI